MKGSAPLRLKATEGQAKIVVIVILALAVVLGVGYVVVRWNAGISEQNVEGLSQTTPSGGEVADSAVGTSQWNAYKGLDLGLPFELKYPAEWIQGGQYDSPALISRGTNFRHPNSLESGDYRGLGVSVTKQKYSDLDQYVRDVESEFTRFSEGVESIQVLASAEVRLGDIQALRREELRGGIILIAVRFIKGGVGYEVAYNPDSDGIASGDRVLADTIFSTIRFMK